MVNPGRGLPFQLQLRPAPWTVVLQRAAFTTVWNGFFGTFLFLMWRHRAATPVWAWALLGLFLVVGVGMLWDALVRAFRAIAGRTAVVEVDRQPCRRGETLQLRLYQPDASALQGLELGLVGERTTSETQGNTTITRTERCYAQEVFRADAADLTGASLDRTLSVSIPDEGVPGSVTWSIRVGLQLKQGGADVQTFPLQVE